MGEIWYGGQGHNVIMLLWSIYWRSINESKWNIGGYIPCTFIPWLFVVTVWSSQGFYSAILWLIIRIFNFFFELICRISLSQTHYCGARRWWKIHNSQYWDTAALTLKSTWVGRQGDKHTMNSSLQYLLCFTEWSNSYFAPTTCRKA